MRRKNLFTSLLLSFLTLTLIVSCRSPQSSSPPSPVVEADSLKVGMVLDGAHTDKSWSQGGYEGLKLIESQYNAQVDFKDSINGDADSIKALRDYAEQDYDLIIAHSGGYITAAETVAKDFPQIKFALVSTYGGNNQNLGAVGFRSGEVGYLTGYLAALKTKTNKVGYIVGADYPVYKEEAALFERGAKAQKPNIEVSTVFLDTWTDTEKATQVAMDLVNSGVDLLAINADEAGIAAIKAVTQKEGVYVIGWTKDLYDVAPGRVITSVLQDIPALVLNAATLVQQGRWEGKLYKFGLREKIYDFAPFRGLLTPDEEAAFKDVRDRVATGKVDITP